MMRLALLKQESDKMNAVLRKATTKEDNHQNKEVTERSVSEEGKLEAEERKRLQEQVLMRGSKQKLISFPFF